ncbi:hypothetical protein [Streptacidiphilus rugosus]|uniref:hypothetical protein n=1 Tax=Streptacidiphilus rugosus TaxID=405783 RepID=UPI0005619E6D|nr:hypothetical protein [Streptacidiphilus rugosus]
MQKIPTLFRRDPDDRAHVLSEVHPDCAWVLAGEGRATRKYDGTCVRLDEQGAWWARREVKPGKTPPPNYVPVQTDEVTGKTMGWEPVGQSAFAKFHAEALAGESHGGWRPGSYELVGPKINGNPERRRAHGLVAHATAESIAVKDLSFEGVRTVVLAAAEADGCEGIVWHHEDGRMAKIKARDFRS